LKPRHKVIALFVGVALITLSVQVTTASTDCPNCKVVYTDGVMTVTDSSTSQNASTNVGPLSLLDPSTAFSSPSQVSLLDIVLKLL